MYPIEELGPDRDDGSMTQSRADLESLIVGRRIASATKWGDSITITLDNGHRVEMESISDCCAYAGVADFVLHADRIDHVILGVGTTDEYQTWHIYADLGDVLTLQVGWSAGNPFYYGYGFNVRVKAAERTEG